MIKQDSAFARCDDGFVKRFSPCENASKQRGPGGSTNPQQQCSFRSRPPSSRHTSRVSTLPSEDVAFKAIFVRRYSPVALSNETTRFTSPHAAFETDNSLVRHFVSRCDIRLRRPDRPLSTRPNTVTPRRIKTPSVWSYGPPAVTYRAHHDLQKGARPDTAKIYTSKSDSSVK